MHVTATLRPQSYVHRMWVDRRRRAGILHGALFRQIGTTFVCDDIPPDSLDFLMANPMVDVTIAAIPTMREAAESPETSIVLPPADALDPTIELEALLAGGPKPRTRQKAR